MASTTLGFFTSPTTTQTPIHRLTFLSKTNLNVFTPISSLSFNKFTFPPSRMSTFSSVTKLSESDTLALESESVSEPTQIIGTTKEETPKGDGVFAVVMIGSRQYIVFPGRFITTQRLKGANVNDKIILNKVLLVGTKSSTYIGKPVVPNAAVHAEVEEQGLNRKVIVFKYKKRKNYRRNIGHRQPNTLIRITGITGYQESPAVTLDS